MHVVARPSISTGGSGGILIVTPQDATGGATRVIRACLWLNGATWDLDWELNEAAIGVTLALH